MLKIEADAPWAYPTSDTEYCIRCEQEIKLSLVEHTGAGYAGRGLFIYSDPGHKAKCRLSCLPYHPWEVYHDGDFGDYHRSMSECEKCNCGEEVE